MVGAIVIEGDIDHLPGIEGVPERMLVLQATQLTPDGSVSSPRKTASQKNYLRLVNGQLNPTITIKPGETQRWRVQNLSPSSTSACIWTAINCTRSPRTAIPWTRLWTRDKIIIGPG